MRDCRVYFRDRSGMEHAVYVQAVHRFHAYGLALDKFRNHSSSWPNEIQKMTIELMNSRWEKVVVTSAQFEGWLKSKSKSDDEERLKIHIQMLLGRLPPDRGFRRGLQVR